MFARLLIYLLVGHCIGDWWLQSDNMALTKDRQILILIEHSLIYSIITALCGFYVTGSLNVFIALLIYNMGIHMILDIRCFTKGWIHIFITKERPRDWIVFVLDQTFHFVSLVFIAELLTKGV